MTTTSTKNGKKGAATDLASLDITEKGDAPQPLTLIDPRTDQVIGEDEGKPATLYVLSYYSETMIAYADEQNDKASKRGKLPTSKDNRERNIATSARLLMARPWEHIEWQGAPLAFNLTNARMLMARLPWAKRQVDEFASREATYLGNSSSDSSTSGESSSSTSTDRLAVV